MSNTTGKRSVRNMQRRQVRRVLNGAKDFFTHAGSAITIRKGWGGGIGKNNVLDRSQDA